MRKLSEIRQHPIMNKIWVRIYDNGQEILSEYPSTREEAAEYGINRYGNGEPCPECGHELKRYTTTGICITCQQLKINFVYWFKNHTFNEPFDQYMMLPKKTVDWMGELQPWIDEARDTGRLPSEKPCKHGHMHYKTPDGKCNVCAEHHIPIALAQFHGLDEYLPVHTCGKCGKKAFRTIENKACTSCISKGINTSVSESLMRDNPDMILSKSDALMLGFKVYRTGKACRNGHTGYRWTANSGCIECMKK